jgi:hypothetical protein
MSGDIDLERDLVAEAIVRACDLAAMISAGIT